ncbi:glycosyl hydrolase [Denitratisoma sp. DHT3]|uniref:WD40/YVTN/BNR-like repeat-containing protein n=1 Tax=Denitratisoma sp. DHT3 TaxID=1981880 RepID=UPI001198C2ED|nr:YCF48-related protein [Denitratisoma sp. DHT3]QDX80600.1 glycosyl hydrolase [Denitratisoma sp. DHT3]
MKAVAVVAAALALFGCSHEADMSAVNAEARKPVKRYDVIQSLAANSKVLVAGTQSGAVLVSRDEGKSWSRQALGPVSLTGMAVCPDHSFVAIDFNHRIWSGDAEGGGWQSHPLEKPRVPLAIACDALGRWHVAGSGAKIARSADRGASWQLTDLDEDAQITTLQMIDADHGVAMGEFGLIARTEDGGVSWKQGTRLAGEFYPYAMVFVDLKEGYASGLAGTVLRTRDGGANWSRIENAAQAPLYRLFLHDGRPYGVGAGGVLARLEGDAFRAVAYPDAVPVFLGGGASIPGQPAVAIGGPGGLVRVVGTHVN